MFHGIYQDPTKYIQVPLQIAAEREITRYYFRQVTLPARLPYLNATAIRSYVLLLGAGLSLMVSHLSCWERNMK